MEVSGTVLRKVTCPSFSRHVPSRGVAPGSGGIVRVSMKSRTVMMDERHLMYYEEKKNKNKNKGTALMSTKKKLKMLKSLSEGLSMFPEFGFALDPQKQALFDDLRGKLTSDAAEILMKQLEQQRADEKEMKWKMKLEKKEKKAKLKAFKKMNTPPDCESSSSSSESSDSDRDCDEVVDMNTMRASVAVATPPTIDDATILFTQTLLPKTATVVETPPKDDVSELFSRDGTCVSSINGGIKNESAVVITAPTPTPTQKRIEVCMGNKCKKSGAAALMQEFEKVVGVEGAAVVSCKCMGKCKSAPNVRIQNSIDALAKGLNDSVNVPANPLFIGVGLDDVETIVDRFLGEENKGDLGLAADL